MSKVVQNIASLFSLTDEKAMLRVKEEADHAAFAVLVKRWEGPIRRLCVRMISDQQRGEDLAQETFSRLFQKRHVYKPTGKFSTYLWRVALNICYDELRRKKRKWESEFEQLETLGEVHRDGLVDKTVSPHQDAARNEEAALVREALAKLPETYRSVLILRHYEGLKLREIAEVLEIPAGTVNSRMAEALSRLSRSLTPKLSKESTRAQEAPRESKVVSIKASTAASSARTLLQSLLATVS